jgi:hypothetical protein
MQVKITGHFKILVPGKINTVIGGIPFVDGIFKVKINWFFGWWKFSVLSNGFY